MRTRLARLIAAISIAMLCVAIGFDKSGAANLDEACGGAGKITCNSALWCQAAGGQCTTADADGKCDKAPTFCMRVSRPVCGCNGKTYPNDCERQKAKVQLDHVGACPKEPKPAEPKAKTPKSKAPKSGKK
ncbi:MAG: Kazal-type serine protease inhibitor family protein [Pseudolabrys sp.]|jgi:hypothetical protein